MLELEARLRPMIAPLHSETVSNRRKRRPPSEVLLARVSALIDLLIKAGSHEAEAAHAQTGGCRDSGAATGGAMPGGGSVSSNGAPISRMGSSRRKPSRNIWP